jgi:cobalamin biosynthesis protein CobD/CbiB
MCRLNSYNVSIGSTVTMSATAQQLQCQHENVNARHNNKNTQQRRQKNKQNTKACNNVKTMMITLIIVIVIIIIIIIIAIIITIITFILHEKNPKFDRVFRYLIPSVFSNPYF